MQHQVRFAADGLITRRGTGLTVGQDLGACTCAREHADGSAVPQTHGKGRCLSQLSFFRLGKLSLRSFENSHFSMLESKATINMK